MEFDSSDQISTSHESIPRCDQKQRNLAKAAIKPVYEEGDAYSDLGGGLKPYRAVEVTPKYPTGLDETVLFALPQDREAVPKEHIEVVRAYELSLDKLTPEQFRVLSASNRNVLAVAGHELLEAVKHRAEVLVIDGNFENPVFAQYRFKSQQEANSYARQLRVLHHDLMTREVVSNIEATYEALEQKSRVSTIRQMRELARHLVVDVSADSEVAIGQKTA